MKMSSVYHFVNALGKDKDVKSNTRFYVQFLADGELQQGPAGLD